MIEITIAGYKNNYDPHNRDMYANPNIPHSPYDPYKYGYQRQNPNEPTNKQQQTNKGTLVYNPANHATRK